MTFCWKKLLLSGAVTFLVPAALQAQTSPAVPELASTFRVLIRDSRQQPKGNVRVTLGKPNAYTLRAVMRGNTSQDGILSFAKVPPGHYTLQLVDPNGETNQFEADVLAKGGKPELSYSWPYIHWMSVKYVSGILMEGPAPLNHRNLILRSFPDERVIASAQTDLQGAFDVPVLSAGRYVLDISRISPNGVSEAVGRVYLEVSLGGERQLEPIFVEQTSRGLEYDHFCSLGNYDLTDPCFQTTGPDGKPLPSAILNVRSEAGFSAAQKFTSDSEGIIKAFTLPAGKYAVQVFAAGTTPVQFTAKLNSNTGACTAPLKILFNTIGSGCAPATPGKAN